MPGSRLGWRTPQVSVLKSYCRPRRPQRSAPAEFFTPFSPERRKSPQPVILIARAGEESASAVLHRKSRFSGFWSPIDSTGVLKSDPSVITTSSLQKLIEQLLELK